MPNDNRNKRRFQTTTKARTLVKHERSESTSKKNERKYTFYDDRSLYTDNFVFTPELKSLSWNTARLLSSHIYICHSMTHQHKQHIPTEYIYIYKPFSTCFGVLSLSTIFSSVLVLVLLAFLLFARFVSIVRCLLFI